MIEKTIIDIIVNASIVGAFLGFVIVFFGRKR